MGTSVRRVAVVLLNCEQLIGFASFVSVVTRGPTYARFGVREANDTRAGRWRYTRGDASHISTLCLAT